MNATSSTRWRIHTSRGCATLGWPRTGSPNLALEYFEGQTITALCDAQQLDLRARVKLLLQVMDPVQYAHAKLVIHCDLKPSNVIVRADTWPCGGGAHVVLLGAMRRHCSGSANLGHGRPTSTASTAIATGTLTRRAHHGVSRDGGPWASAQRRIGAEEWSRGVTNVFSRGSPFSDKTPSFAASWDDLVHDPRGRTVRLAWKNSSL